MSRAGERVPNIELSPQWRRLEALAEESAVVTGFWRRRALEAEAEVARLRQALDEVAAMSTVPGDLRDEVRRVRAENAALQSRLAEARARIQGIMKRLLALGVDV